MEEWRDVPGYEGKYQISIDTPEGRCRSLNYHKTGKTCYLSNKVSSRGRIGWTLYNNGEPKRMDAGRWVALTYPELVQNKYFEGAQIDHIDTNRINNHPSNLRWVTNKENCNNPLTRVHISQAQKGRVFSDETKHKISQSQIGKKVTDETREKLRISHKGQIASNRKAIAQYSKAGVLIKVYSSAMEAAREIGGSFGNIASAARGKRMYAYNSEWKYVE